MTRALTLPLALGIISAVILCHPSATHAADPPGFSAAAKSPGHANSGPIRLELPGMRTPNMPVELSRWVFTRPLVPQALRMNEFLRH